MVKKNIEGLQSKLAIQPPLCRHLATMGDGANCKAKLKTVNERDPINPLTNLERPHLRVESSSTPHHLSEAKTCASIFLGGMHSSSI
jgi:hypothetical protein